VKTGGQAQAKLEKCGVAMDKPDVLTFIGAAKNSKAQAKPSP
jgi:hypothetical protein